MDTLFVVFKRIVQAVPTVFGIIVVTFVLTRALPGDPAVYFAGAAADAQSIAEIRKSMRLDRSLPEQFLFYLRDLATGDLGTAIRSAA